MRRKRYFCCMVFLTCAFLAGEDAALRAFPGQELREELDIPYVDGGGHRQQLDLYLPSGTHFPVILFVHGGGLLSEDRKDDPYPSIGRAFQAAAVGCAVMSYRPGSEVPWPAQPRDVTAAFAWIKTRIGSRGGNPEQIFLVGHSSGGLLVATVATDSTFLKEWNLSLRDIAGCVPMGTLLTAEPVERTWSPDRLASLFATNSYMKLFRTPEIFNTAHNPVPLAESPAFLILVAEGEREQPPILASAETFTASVIKAGGHGAFEILPERTHRTTIFLMTTPDDTTVQRIVKFINDTMAP